jgi:hypothetical protein
MADWTFNDAQLVQFIASLNSSYRRTAGPASKWIRKLTVFTQGRMKKYASVKTRRSTGNLANSIRSQYTFGGGVMTGEVFVPERVKYQFAAEEGIQKRFTIYGKPLMAFPAENWKKAGRLNSSVVKVGKGGVYIFASVKRGRYKGRRYTERAFQDLLSYYASNESQILAELGRTLVFSTAN